jgi:hypothetical protein
VSVRGKNDALQAVQGGAHIIDAEYPGSALGTCYPANIHTIRQYTPGDRLVSTNIGEKQFVWSTAGQAAVGVAYAGADIVKVGLAELDGQHAKKVMRDVTKQVRFFFKRFPRVMITTLFADEKLRRILDPIARGAVVSVYAKADGVLIDTFDKECGKGLLDWLTLRDIRRFVMSCHTAGQEAWIAGSITRVQMPSLWRTGVDVICVRGAACEKGTGRQGAVDADFVRSLVKTIP